MLNPENPIKRASGISQEDRAIIDLAEDYSATAFDYWNDQHDMGMTDVEFYNGDQWLPGAFQRRLNEGRPAVKINLLHNFVNSVLGEAFAESMGVTLSAPPQGKNAPGFTDSEGRYMTATTVKDGMLKHIGYICDAQSHFKRAMMHILTGGYAFLRVRSNYINELSMLTNLSIECIDDCFQVWPDPAFKHANAADMNHCFVNLVMSRREFEHAYPGKTGGAIIGNARFRGMMAAEREKKKNPVSVTEFFLRELVPAWIVHYTSGDLTTDGTRIFTKAAEAQEFINDLGKSGHVYLGSRTTRKHRVLWYLMSNDGILDRGEWPGSRIPIIFVPGRETRLPGGVRRYISLFHHSKDAQTSINVWMSNALEKIGAAPKGAYMGTVEQFEGLHEYYENSPAYNTLVRPYRPVTFRGHLLPPPQYIDPSTMASAEIEMVMQLVEQMKMTMGLYEVKTGGVDNQRSGKAMQMQKTQSDINAMEFVGNMHNAVAETFRVVLENIAHFYGDRRVLTIMDAQAREQNVELQDPDLLDVDLSAEASAVLVASGPNFMTIYEKVGELLLEFIKQGHPAALDMLVVYLELMDVAMREVFIERMLPYLNKASLTKEQMERLEEKGISLEPSPAEKLQHQELELKTETERTKQAKEQVNLRKAEAELAELLMLGDESKARKLMVDIAKNVYAEAAATEQ